MTGDSAGARLLRNDTVGDTTGAVVVIDVLRAFTTAAYAFAAGAARIYLVSGVGEALALKAAIPGALAMGEDGGLTPEGFDLPNSPVRAAAADLSGRTIVQRTSAGTQGVVAARRADRLWCASLVCASATAAAVGGAGLGDPTYVITGHRPERSLSGADDIIGALYIEAVRRGDPVDPAAAAHAIRVSDEAARTLVLGPEHVDPLDIDFAVDVDRFAFAMEVTRDATGHRLDRVSP
ncbi:MAG: 2-phosphosulfolactate phosphatase [Jatrophihabitantaceae bacterium]|nr:2-phosphosulfolactate phosphatase [Jatrophihabitantaceae bacterium]